MALLLGILTFEDDRLATQMLAEHRRRQSDPPWTREVGVIERHPSGRISIRGTFGGDFFADTRTEDTGADLEQGTLTGALLGALTGPAGAAVGGNIGSALGELLGAATEQGNQSVYGLIRNTLPRGTSALVLLAGEALVDLMLSELRGVASRAVRHAVEAGPRSRLEALLRRGRQEHEAPVP
jgi:uncharacterized membrane protein